ncbi:MAG TPA: hypothetical protein VGR33_00530 [Actinomycetota bacterium]|jgi:hypothetical protein|nr:hypothetical protein [Actinomycetota bacterium]
MSDVPGGPIPPPPPPPPGTPPGPGGIRPRTLGEILSEAFRIYRENAAKLMVIVAVIVVPLSFISAVLVRLLGEPKAHRVEILGQPATIEYSRSFGVTILVILIGAAIGVIIWAILQAAMLRGAAQATIGDPVDVEASYRWGLNRFGSVLLVAFLVGIVVGVGFILLVIPGIIFLVFLSVSEPALIVENRRGTDAMSRSWNLVRGHFWHALVVILVAAIITGIVQGILTAIGGDNWFVRWIFTAIAQIITAPFTALVTVLLYLDLRARKEALTAERLRTELASSM